MRIFIVLILLIVGSGNFIYGSDRIEEYHLDKRGLNGSVSERSTLETDITSAAHEPNDHYLKDNSGETSNKLYFYHLVSFGGLSLILAALIVVMVIPANIESER